MDARRLKKNRGIRILAMLMITLLSLMPLSTGFAQGLPEYQVTAIATSSLHTVALRADGTVWAWGDNKFGQIGDGTYTDKHTPVQVIGLTDVISIAANDNYTVALKSDGSVWAWGDNTYGKLGNGNASKRNTPVQVVYSNGTAFTGVTAIAAGENHTVALKSDGSVWTWGDNRSGQLGNGTFNTSFTPVQVKIPSGNRLSGITAIGAGGKHTVALKNDGTVWAWGGNFYGQLGDGTNNDRRTAVQVKSSTETAFSGITDIAAGGFHTVALRGDGTVWTWGRNYNGQLGNGTTTDSDNPVWVMNPTGTTFTGVTNIEAGTWYTSALKKDGTVWAWGDNDSGQLGDGTMTDKHTPVWVNGLTEGTAIGSTAIAAGGWSAAALRGDGTVWTWGNNENGQLGDGSTFDRLTPVEVHWPNVLPNVGNEKRTGSENTTVKFLSTDFASVFTDGNGESLNKVKIATLPANGTLRLNDDPITRNYEIMIYDLSHINFLPNANWYGTTAFTWYGHDGTDYSLYPATMTISVTPVNKAPTVAESSKSGSEDTLLQFQATDFTSVFNDSDGDPLNKIKIITVPSNGTLRVKETPVKPGYEITTANISDLNFLPNANWNGTTSFTWYGHDGTDYSLYPSTMIIEIIDVPVIIVPVAVTGVELDVKELTLNMDEAYTLTATVSPEDAANNNVTWSSDNAEVVTVDNGLVTPTGEGTATITVTTEDGGYTAICVVTVSSPTNSN